MKYWDKAWSLIDDCSSISPACQNYWLATINIIKETQDIKNLTEKSDYLIKERQKSGFAYKRRIEWTNLIVVLNLTI